jgi:serine/threonine protein kinase
MAHDWGETEDGSIFAVYELITGDSLPWVVPESGLATRRAIGIVRTLGDALSEIHRKGILHRALHPTNMMVRDPGTSHETAVIVDFGKAALSGEPDDDKSYLPPLP